MPWVKVGEVFVVSLGKELLVAELPQDLIRVLHEMCKHLGLETSTFVEQALCEKIEDLFDTCDLEEARKSAVEFAFWEDIQCDFGNAGESG